MSTMAHELGQTDAGRGITFALKMPPLDRKAIGRRIRAARESMGLSQEGLAELMEIDRKMVGFYESGRHLSLDAVEKVAVCTGHDFDWLITGDERLVDRTVLQTISHRLEAIEKHLGI